MKRIIISTILIFMSIVNFSYAKVSGSKTLDDRAQMLNTHEFEVYSEQPTRGRFYTGALFEPRSGVIHGTPYNVPFDGLENRINTEYFWFDLKQTNDVHNRYIDSPQYTERTHELYALNWNCQFKDQHYNVDDYDNFIKNTVDNISANGKDNILIFGKEFNIDDNYMYPEDFIAFFRRIAEYAHTKDNVAMCWSPNDTGSLDVSFEEFWPGSEYVDWIGTSLYVFNYFQGDPIKNDYGTKIGFLMGEYANPTKRANILFDFMERNGIYKPVFITEGAVGFGELPGRPLYTNGVEYLDWSIQQTRKYYEEMTRRYPLIKIIVCFNFVYPTDFYRYDMANEPLLADYIRYRVDKGNTYVKHYGEFSPNEYVPLEPYTAFANKLKLSSFVYEPTALYLTVRYKIDGTVVYETPYPPYEYTIDSSVVTPGEHILTVDKLSGEDVLETRDFTINYTGKGDALFFTRVKGYLNGLEIPIYKYLNANENQFYIRISDLENYGWDVTKQLDGSFLINRNYEREIVGGAVGPQGRAGDFFALVAENPFHISIYNGDKKSTSTESFIANGYIYMNIADMLYVTYYENNAESEERVLLTYN